MEVVRKDIKNLHLAVYPPLGRVRVAVPLRVNDDAVRLAVISRLGWIRRQQGGFQQQHRQSEREMVRGESHYVQGRRFRLDVIEHDGSASVGVRNNHTLELRVRPGANRQKREATLQQWYRQLLREQIPELIAKWEPVIGVKVADWGIKKMKTRWGPATSLPGEFGLTSNWPRSQRRAWNTSWCMRWFTSLNGIIMISSGTTWTASCRSGGCIAKNSTGLR